MPHPLNEGTSALAPKFAAPQHRPRPLPLFLDMLRGETAASPERTARALEGLRRYQEAKRDAAREPMPAIAASHGATLRDYGGSGAPVLFIPSLINPPNILDLDEEKSLLRWLAGRGHRPLLVDWGWEVTDRKAMSVGDHVEAILLPFLEQVGEPVALVGYCLGGTMAAAAAALTPARSLATIAAPWHFSGFPDDDRAKLGRLWEKSRTASEALGMLPMEVLQSAFWSLDPARTIAKFEAFAQMQQASPKARAFVRLEDWANDGPPLPHAAARELFEDFVGADLPGTGRWRIGGRTIDPAALSCPLFNIVSATDRIVPHASAIGPGERLDLEQGHVGMVVGGRARAALWEPLAAWLSRPHPS